MADLVSTSKMLWLLLYCILALLYDQTSSVIYRVTPQGERLAVPADQQLDPANVKQLALEEATLAELRSLPLQALQALTPQQVAVFMQAPKDAIDSLHKRTRVISRLYPDQLAALGPALFRYSRTARRPLGTDSTVFAPAIFRELDPWPIFSQHHLSTAQLYALLHLPAEYRDREGIFADINTALESPHIVACRVVKSLVELSHPRNPRIAMLLQDGLVPCNVNITRTARKMATQRRDKSISALSKLQNWLSRLWQWVMRLVYPIAERHDIIPSSPTFLQQKHGRAAYLALPYTSLCSRSGNTFLRPYFYHPMQLSVPHRSASILPSAFLELACLASASVDGGHASVGCGRTGDPIAAKCSLHYCSTESNRCGSEMSVPSDRFACQCPALPHPKGQSN